MISTSIESCKYGIEGNIQPHLQTDSSQATILRVASPGELPVF